MSQLTKDPCSNFRRPNGPSDELLVNVPSMASFAAAAVEGGIEHDSVTSLYQVCTSILQQSQLTQCLAPCSSPLLSCDTYVYTF